MGEGQVGEEGGSGKREKRWEKRRGEKGREERTGEEKRGQERRKGKKREEKDSYLVFNAQSTMMVIPGQKRSKKKGREGRNEEQKTGEERRKKTSKKGCRKDDTWSSMPSQPRWLYKVKREAKREKAREGRTGHGK